MAKGQRIRSVLVIGSGPIVIGQAAEFDYSGTQALRVLKEEGLRVILINSNPATIMTDPEFADATYVEPITPEVVEKIIIKECPDALLPTLGGQTALNTAISLARNGILEKYGVKLIGARVEAIEAGEDREEFKAVVERCGAQTARSKIVHSMDEAFSAVEDLNYPVVVRPSFTMGGLGSGVAYHQEDLHRIVTAGLQYSPTTEVLLEESILGWKEYELELMRDRADNVVVVCSIENFDPVGVHTGDSITVAPAMTLTDREYQRLRDIAIAVIREVGVDTGGCNIQFAVEPDTGRVIVIEMNPRVSRSSALASKATGFPIAKIATKLSLGYTLDEITNDITQKTPACFEPSLDYVVVKMPRFAFEKFPAADATLTTTMKSVGEVMAIGRNFTEALQKAVRSLEEQSNSDQRTKSFDFSDIRPGERDKLMVEVKTPAAHRIFSVQRALLAGVSVAKLHQLTSIDPWFLDQVQMLNEIAADIKSVASLSKEKLQEVKRHGFSDAQIAELTQSTEIVIQGIRRALGVCPVYKTIDTCAAEFEAQTSYYYSSYDMEDELQSHEKESVIILGSGPNRIGQGVEFDYSCVHASMILSDYGYETVMINCNPETVSTDYDMSSRLYLEPLTLEDVLEVIEAEKRTGGVLGVFVQLGGQTPLKLAQGLVAAGVPILGTSPEAIDLAEERGAFSRLLDKVRLCAPKNGTAVLVDEAKDIAAEVGYPVLVRPSYVLGGRGMEIVYDEQQLEFYIRNSTEITTEHPVLIDRFLEDAIEIDVDALYDGRDLYLGGIMEHIEEAGVHSGDSACVLPPVTLTRKVIHDVRVATEAIARAVGVRGLINIQFALAADTLYVLEANPRASRTVPFVSKVTGVQLAKAAALIGVGKTIPQLQQDRLLKPVDATYVYENVPVAVKEAVLPFNRFRTPQGVVVDSLLGPEMRSTGEVMGIDRYFDTAFAKSQAAANSQLPTSGKVFLSVANRDKRSIVMIAKRLVDFGFEILSTGGTADVLTRNGIEATLVSKVGDPGIGGKTIVDLINEGDVAMVFNTPSGGRARGDGYEIRAAGTSMGIPVITTLAEIVVAMQAIEAMRKYSWDVTSLQEYARSFGDLEEQYDPEGKQSEASQSSFGHSKDSSLTLLRENQASLSQSSSVQERVKVQDLRALIQNDSGPGTVDGAS